MIRQPRFIFATLAALFAVSLLVSGGRFALADTPAPEHTEKPADVQHLSDEELAHREAEAHSGEHADAHDAEAGHAEEHDAHAEPHGETHGDEHDAHDAHGGEHGDAHGGHFEVPEHLAGVKAVDGLATEIHHIDAGHAPHDIASVFSLAEIIWHDELGIIKKKKAAYYFAKQAQKRSAELAAEAQAAEQAGEAEKAEELTHAAAENEKAADWLYEQYGHFATLEARHDVGLVDYFIYYFKKNDYGIIAAIIVAFYAWLAWKIARGAGIIPNRWGAAGDMIVGGFYDFLSGILGPKDARKYLPFLGTIFFFILANNFMSITIFLKSPSAVFFNNLGVAICVFFYSQYIGLTRMGPKHFFLHLVGDPKDAIGWALSPLFLFLEVVGELVRPISLSLRLFGNILGEDILLLVFCAIGIMMISPIPGGDYVPFGLPLHLLISPLVILFSTIQALVFTLLSAVYISLKIPHGHHDEHEAHAH